MLNDVYPIARYKEVTDIPRVAKRARFFEPIPQPMEIDENKKDHPKEIRIPSPNSAFKPFKR